MKWLYGFSIAAARTDLFVGNQNHVALLAAGLFGEAGSILAELKKEERERNVYPGYRSKLTEELGDFLWYYVRLVTLFTPKLFETLPQKSQNTLKKSAAKSVKDFLELGAIVGEVLSAITVGTKEQMESLLRKLWGALMQIESDTGISLRIAASQNQRKTNDRWPVRKTYSPVSDEKFPQEEQLPRRLEVEFTELVRNRKKIVILRCNGVNFGDRLTDNIGDPDWYRFHDIFHFAYAVHLGWSPVTRALLHCKRKSKPAIDENEDGARASIIEEAVSAIVFSHAKELSYFDGLDHLSYNLLKTVKEFVVGFEVARIPLWQWEIAILDGFRVFRLLSINNGGRVILNLRKHKLDYIRPRKKKR